MGVEEHEDNGHTEAPLNHLSSLVPARYFQWRDVAPQHLHFVASNTGVYS